MNLDRFVEPPWDAPFDVEAQIAAIPEDATISGMFPAAVVAPAKKKGIGLPSARSTYQPFKFYPLREHGRLLCEASRLMYPKMSTRQALRVMGSFGPRALMKSLIGKVVLGSAKGVQASLEGMAHAYALNMKPGTVRVLRMSETDAILSLEQICNFVDSHHVGTFEGVLAYAGVKGEVRIATIGIHATDFHIRWAT
jgi:uncharacterized protein (TIGR02265 family)